MHEEPNNVDDGSTDDLIVVELGHSNQHNPNFSTPNNPADKEDFTSGLDSLYEITDTNACEVE